MPSDFPHLRYLFDRGTHLKYRRLMKTLQSSLSFDASDPAKFRLHVLEYYYKYGLRPALDAFKVKKSTLYDWRKRYELSLKRLNSLVPQSTRPHRTRAMNTDWRLVAFVKQIRMQYGSTGARIIKPFLDEYAKSLGISSLGRTTIEKLIRRHRLTFKHSGQAKRHQQSNRLRVKSAPKVKLPGYVEIDTIEIRILGTKYYFVSLIDVFTRFAWVELIKKQSSVCTLEVLPRFITHYQYHIHTVQTDNGSEFLKDFDAYLTKIGVNHVFTYPRSPKINGVVERFNRTVQEEFIRQSTDFGVDKLRFEHQLSRYLSWYNQKRPHSSLGYISPVEFMNQIPKCV